MSILNFCLVMTGVILNALAQSMLKLGAIRLGENPFSGRSPVEIALAVLGQWPYLAGFACYGVSLVVWIFALTRVPVTIAYPMLSVGYILNALIARIWLGESLSAGGWGAMALICLGVALLARSH
jgi:multidrug transporter EmrE-like cation transporter